MVKWLVRIGRQLVKPRKTGCTVQHAATIRIKTGMDLFATDGPETDAPDFGRNTFRAATLISLDTPFQTPECFIAQSAVNSCRWLLSHHARRCTIIRDCACTTQRPEIVLSCLTDTEFNSAEVRSMGFRTALIHLRIPEATGSQSKYFRLSGDCNCSVKMAVRINCYGQCEVRTSIPILRVCYRCFCRCFWQHSLPCGLQSGITTCSWT